MDTVGGRGKRGGLWGKVEPGGFKESDVAEKGLGLAGSGHYRPVEMRERLKGPPFSRRVSGRGVHRRRSFND